MYNNIKTQRWKFKGKIKNIPFKKNLVDDSVNADSASWCVMIERVYSWKKRKSGKFCVKRVKPLIPNGSIENMSRNYKKDTVKILI